MAKTSKKVKRVRWTRLILFLIIIVVIFAALTFLFYNIFKESKIKQIVVYDMKLEVGKNIGFNIEKYFSTKLSIRSFLESLIFGTGIFRIIPAELLLFSGLWQYAKAFAYGEFSNAQTQFIDHLLLSFGLHLRSFFAFVISK